MPHTQRAWKRLPCASMTNTKNTYEAAKRTLDAWKKNGAVHEQRMHALYILAQKAKLMGETPVAASLWCGDQQIAQAHNLVEEKTDPMMHAEYIVVRDFINFYKKKYLDQCTLYVTLFPCRMCMEFLSHMRLYGLCYGADTPDKSQESRVFPRVVLGGVLQDRCSGLLKKFFSEKR